MWRVWQRMVCEKRMKRMVFEFEEDGEVGEVVEQEEGNVEEGVMEGVDVMRWDGIVLNWLIF